MKLHPVGAELSHADRRTDMTKMIVAFRKSAKAPKKICFILCYLLTYLLTPWCRVLLEKLVKKFPEFHGT